MVLLQASSGTAMEQYVGIDVSLEQSSVCVVVQRAPSCKATVASEPDALTACPATPTNADEETATNSGRPNTPYRRVPRDRSELLPVGFTPRASAAS